METNFNAICDMLREHDYQVVVTNTSFGCELFLPGTPHRLPRAVKYVVTEQGVNNTTMPAYAARPFILIDICRQCSSIGFDTRLISYHIDGNNGDEHELLSSMPHYCTVQEEDLEQHLLELISLAMMQDFSDSIDKYAEEAGVLKGFEIIKSNFLKESFE